MLRPKPTMISLSMKDVTEHLESIDRKATKARAEGAVAYSGMRRPLTDLPTTSSPPQLVGLEAPTVIYLSGTNHDRDPRIQGITPVPITTDMLHSFDLPSRARDSAEPRDPFAFARSIEALSLAESQSENTRTTMTASASTSNTRRIHTPDSAHQDPNNHSPGFLESEHPFYPGDSDFLNEDQDSIMTRTPGPGGSPMPRVPRASVDYNDSQYSPRMSRESSLGKPLPEGPAIEKWEDLVWSSPVQDDYHQYLCDTTSARAGENSRARPPSSRAMNSLLSQRFSQLQVASAQLPYVHRQHGQGTQFYPPHSRWPQRVDSVPEARAERPLSRTSGPLFQIVVSPCSSEESYMRKPPGSGDEGVPMLRDNPHLRFVEVVVVNPNTLHRRHSHLGLIEWADDIYLTPKELAMAQNRLDQDHLAQNDVASASVLDIRRQRPRQTMAVTPMKRNVEYPSENELSPSPSANVTPRSRQRSRRLEQRMASAQRPLAMDRELSENVIPRTLEPGRDAFLGKRFKSSKPHDLILQQRLTSKNLVPEDASTPSAMSTGPPSLPNSMTFGQLGREQHQTLRVPIPPIVARNMQIGRLDNIDGRQRSRELARSPLLNSVHPDGTPMRTTSTIGLSPLLASPGTPSTLFGQPPGSARTTRTTRTTRTYRQREMTYSYEESENPNAYDIPEQEVNIHEDETAHPEYDDARYYDWIRQYNSRHRRSEQDEQGERADHVDHDNEDEMQHSQMMANSEFLPAEQPQLVTHEEHTVRAAEYHRVRHLALPSNIDAAMEKATAAQEGAHREESHRESERLQRTIATSPARNTGIARARRQTDETIERLEREMREHSLQDNDHDDGVTIEEDDIEQRTQARLRRYHASRAAHLQFARVAQERESEAVDMGPYYQREIEQVAQEYAQLDETPEQRRYRERMESIAYGYHEKAAHLRAAEVSTGRDSGDEDMEADYQRGVEEVAQEYAHLLSESPEARRYHEGMEHIALSLETVQSNRRRLARINSDPDPARRRERLRRALQDYHDSDMEDGDEEGAAVASSPPAPIYERGNDRGDTGDMQHLRSPSASILSGTTAAGSALSASTSLQLPRPFSASPRRVSDYSTLPAQPSMYPTQDDDMDKGRRGEFNRFQAARFGGTSSSMDVQVGDSPFLASPARRNDSSQIDGSPDPAETCSSRLNSSVFSASPGYERPLRSATSPYRSGSPFPFMAGRSRIADRVPTPYRGSMPSRVPSDGVGVESPASDQTQRQLHRANTSPATMDRPTPPRRQPPRVSTPSNGLETSSHHQSDDWMSIITDGTSEGPFDFDTNWTPRQRPLAPPTTPGDLHPSLPAFAQPRLVRADGRLRIYDDRPGVYGQPQTIDDVPESSRLGGARAGQLLRTPGSLPGQQRGRRTDERGRPMTEMRVRRDRGGGARADSPLGERGFGRVGLGGGFENTNRGFGPGRELVAEGRELDASNAVGGEGTSRRLQFDTPGRAQGRFESNHYIWDDDDDGRMPQDQLLGDFARPV